MVTSNLAIKEGWEWWGKQADKTFNDLIEQTDFSDSEKIEDLVKTLKALGVDIDENFTK